MRSLLYAILDQCRPMWRYRNDRIDNDIFTVVCFFRSFFHDYIPNFQKASLSGGTLWITWLWFSTTDIVRTVEDSWATDHNRLHFTDSSRPSVIVWSSCQMLIFIGRVQNVAGWIRAVTELLTSMLMSCVGHSVCVLPPGGCISNYVNRLESVYLHVQSSRVITYSQWGSDKCTL